MAVIGGTSAYAGAGAAVGLDAFFKAAKHCKQEQAAEYLYLMLDADRQKELANDIEAQYDVAKFPANLTRTPAEEAKAARVKKAVLDVLAAITDDGIQSYARAYTIFSQAAGSAWKDIHKSGVSPADIFDPERERDLDEQTLYSLRQSIKQTIIEVADLGNWDDVPMTPGGEEPSDDKVADEKVPAKDDEEEVADAESDADGDADAEEKKAAPKAKKAKKAEEEAQEPTERANFVERRGSPTRGTVYIHYRNWPTHFYYYFKDGEIGVIRNKPRPPEGAVRGWHLAELGDMDLFPSGTSGWTTLYGEMRDLIRARKLAEVDRFNDTPADLGLVIPAAIPEYPDSQMRDFLKDQGRSDSQVESIMTSDRLRQALVLKMKSLGMTPAVGGRTGDIEAALPSEDAPGTSEPIGRSRTSFNRKRHTWKIPEEHRQAFDFGSGYGKARVKKIILRDSEPFEVTPELAFTGTRGPFIDVVIDVAPDNPLAGRRSLRRIGSRNQAYDDIIEYIRNNSDNFNA
jgi:hypothetical protein